MNNFQLLIVGAPRLLTDINCRCQKYPVAAAAVVSAGKQRYGKPG